MDRSLLSRIRAYSPQLVLLALLALYCNRDEGARRMLQKIHTTEGFQKNWKALVWPPWQSLRTYVSLDDDVHLYYEFSRVLLGEEPDLPYIADWQAIPAADKARRDALHTALTAKRGIRVPYRDVNVGFPPLALLLMVVPRALTATYAAYRIGFAVEVCVLYLLTWWMVLRLAELAKLALSRRELWWRAAVATACLGPLLIGRFDVLPTFFTVAALLALVRGRGLAAGSLLLLGVGAKLYPLLLLPTWIALLLGRGRRALGLLGSFLVPFIAVAATGAGVSLWQGRRTGVLLDNLVLFSQRPIQIESLLGSIFHVGGAAVSFAFSSENVVLGKWDWLVQAADGLMVSAALGLAGLAYGWARRNRGAPPEVAATGLCQFTAAALLGILLTSKLLAPQYLIWILPLCALLDGAWGKRVFLAYCGALALTQIYFPFMWSLVASGVRPLRELVLVRNLILCGMLVAIVRKLAGARSPAPAAPY